MLMPTRRHVLAAAPAAACAGGPDPAAAWRNPGAGEADPRRFALAHAILAPNRHNRQPWLVDLAGDDALVLYADLERLLPATDPFDRQITIGCGTFLELLSLAGAERGFAAEVTPFPDGEPQPRLDQRPVAHVRLVSGGVRDPLFAQIPSRRTNREPYESRDLAQDTLDAVIAPARRDGLVIETARGGAARDHLRTLAWDGFDREAHTPAAHRETAELVRVGAGAIARHRDGIAVRGLMPDIAGALGLVSVDDLANPDSAFTKPTLDAWRPLAEASPAFIWIKSKDNTRATQLAAGRAYARLNLSATAQGLAIHPWSQALQEYSEMAELMARMETLTATQDGETVQMLVRAGYPTKTPPPAPRRGLEEHMRGRQA
jgi:nitroreductase